MPEPIDDTEEGFLLVAMVVAIFLILLVLSVAAPRVAMQLKREREVETAHRANQYVRGIRMYYKKFQNYPASMEALKKSNNIRFLRQEYVDPMTGEKDWKLIRVGQNKTKVKGFFGQDLPGIAGGLGAAAGMSSGTGTASSTSATSPISPSASSSPTGSSTGSTGSTTGSAFGSTPSPGSGSTSGSSSLDSLSGGVGPFMGVSVPKSGEAILVVNEQTNYQDWEFLYDPRIEQMYAKASLLGGGVTSGNATGLGSAGSLGSGFGTTNGAGTSGTGTTGTGAPGATGSGSTSTPTPTTPP